MQVASASANDNISVLAAAKPNSNNSVASASAAANDDVSLDALVRDMLYISKFVYIFRTIQDIVRKNDQNIGDGRDCVLNKDNHGNVDEESKCFPVWPFSRKPKRVDFNTPALIITDKGAQDGSVDRNFKYTVTPNAIAEFIVNNRHHFEENNKGNILFDKSKKEGKEQFLYRMTHLAPKMEVLCTDWF